MLEIVNNWWTLSRLQLTHPNVGEELMDLIKTSPNTSKCRRRNLKKRWDFTSFRTKTINYRGRPGKKRFSCKAGPLPAPCLLHCQNLYRQGKRKSYLFAIYITYQRNKSSLKIHYCSSLNIVSLPERPRQDGFNIVMKSCMMKPKWVMCAIRVMTRKTNQTKYHEINILYWYLINLI